LSVSELRLVMARDCVPATAARLLANCRLDDTSVKSDRIPGDITSLGTWRPTQFDVIGIRPYGMLCSIHWYLMTFRDNLSVQSSRVKQSKKVVGLLDP